jgi:hypothetical protein
MPKLELGHEEKNRTWYRCCVDVGNLRKIKLIVVSMNETSPMHGSRRKRSRLFGYGLLFTGFLWLAWSAAIFPVYASTGTASQISDNLTRKDGFSEAEVSEALFKLSRTIGNQTRILFIPALMMLTGGLLLGSKNTEPG